MTSPAPKPFAFTGYQIFVVAVLAFLQFTIVLDFMILSPLGAIVMPALDISPQQFGLIVSSYAFSAGIAGFLAAGFADRYDRKRFLLFFYVGFILGTVLCGLAQDFHLLLFGRIVTGLFGGVMGAAVMAITTDLFPMEMRGRVIGLVQTSFAVTQILGIPIGLYLSNWWNWHAPFFMIVAVSVPAVAAIAFFMRPVDAHLGLKQERNPFLHLVATVREPRHLLPFAAITLLATGGYMLMPFGSAFTVNNLQIDIAHLPTIYLVTGVCMIVMGPLVGRASDRFGKFPVFFFGTAVSAVMVIYYTHMGATPLITVIIVNVILFLGILSRIVPSQALMSAVPEVTKRGSFNAVSASLQQVSGGIAATLAGSLIVQRPDGYLEHFTRIGYVIVGAAAITLYFMYRIHRMVPEKPVNA